MAESQLVPHLQVFLHVFEGVVGAAGEGGLLPEGLAGRAQRLRAGSIGQVVSVIAAASDRERGAVELLVRERGRKGEFLVDGWCSGVGKSMGHDNLN